MRGGCRNGRDLTADGRRVGRRRAARPRTTGRAARSTTSPGRTGSQPLSDRQVLLFAPLRVARPGTSHGDQRQCQVQPKTRTTPRPNQAPDGLCPTPYSAGAPFGGQYQKAGIVLSRTPPEPPLPSESGALGRHRRAQAERRITGRGITCYDKPAGRERPAASPTRPEWAVTRSTPRRSAAAPPGSTAGRSRTRPWPPTSPSSTTRARASGERRDGGGGVVLPGPPRRRAEPDPGTDGPGPGRLPADRRRARPRGRPFGAAEPGRHPRHLPPAPE